MAKLFTKTELKRLKYTKIKVGMTEKEANKSIELLIEEVKKNRVTKPLGRPKKEVAMKKMNETFKSKFKELYK